LGGGELRELGKEMRSFSSPCGTGDVVNWGFGDFLWTARAGFRSCEGEGGEICPAAAEFEFDIEPFCHSNGSAGLRQEKPWLRAVTQCGLFPVGKVALGACIEAIMVIWSVFFTVK